jgi:2-polyprenyl-6-methoxyphenol hydroxylase-like FAD-dependent oxidoreductase
MVVSTANPAARRRAIVVGGSVGGLAAGLMFRRAGWQVDVFERALVDQRARGAGIVTHPQLFAALHAIGIPSAAVSGTAFTRRIMLDRAGRTTHELEFPQTGTAWSSVYAALAEAYGGEGLHSGAEFVGCTETCDGVTARFANGFEASADILVGADGIRSAVRRSIFPEVGPVYAGYITWRGVVPSNASPASRHRQLFEEFCFCLPEREQIAAYPIGRGPDARACNFVWYRPASSRTLRRFLTDASGKYHPLGIPPPLVQMRYINAMRDDAAGRLAPQFADLINSLERPFFQPIYDLETPMMYCGRIALIGDAAFVARPHVGAGVTKALQDAISLVQALEGELSIGRALCSFNKERHPTGGSIVAMARKLGAYMQAEQKTEQERLYAAIYRNPLAVLSDQASLNFLARETPANANTLAPH